MHLKLILNLIKVEFDIKNCSLNYLFLNTSDRNFNIPIKNKKLKPKKAYSQDTPYYENQDTIRSIRSIRNEMMLVGLPPILSPLKL